MKLSSAILLLVLVATATASRLTSVVTSSDSVRISKLFQGKYSDLESAYHSVTALKSLTSGGAVGSVEKESACELAKNADATSVTELGYAGALVKALQCNVEFSSEAVELATSKLESTNMKTLFSAVSFLTAAGVEVDSSAVMAALSASMKQDNSVLSSSLAIQAAAMLPNKEGFEDLLATADIEDMAAQADEVDSKYLHFENSLETTSAFLTAVFVASEVTGQTPAVSNNQAVMLCNYLLRLKNSASSSKQASMMVAPLGHVVSNKHVTVAMGEVVSGTSVSESRPKIQMLFSNVFGQPITSLKVTADSVTSASDNSLLVDGQDFNFDGLRLYELTVWKGSPKSGFYDVSLSVSSSSGKQLVGISTMDFRVKVTAKITLKNIQLGVANKDSAGSLKDVQYLGKTAPLKAEKAQRIVMKFQVVDSATEQLIQPHQAFVRFEHRSTKEDVIFVAESDSQKTYKFEVDLSTNEELRTGLYSMQLIVGDATISNPVFWNFADITLKLGEMAPPKQSALKNLYITKPPISHKFREAEERPPAIVSQAFTVACLLPLVGLLVAWRSVGANLNGLKLAPKNIIFHLGLAGIFYLYYMFWIKLNMFTTLQYLFGIGSITFVFGNSVLSEMANSRN